MFTRESNLVERKLEVILAHKLPGKGKFIGSSATERLAKKESSRLMIAASMHAMMLLDLKQI